LTPDKSKVKEKSKDVRLITFLTYPGKNALNGKTIVLLLSAKLELHVLKLQLPQESTVLKIILPKLPHKFLHVHNFSCLIYAKACYLSNFSHSHGVEGLVSTCYPNLQTQQHHAVTNRQLKATANSLNENISLLYGFVETIQ